MKKYVLIITTIIILSAIFLSGCNQDGTNTEGKKTFIGTWKVEIEGVEKFNETWTFKEDNTVEKVLNQDGVITRDHYKWEDTGFELCMIPIGPGDQRCGSYKFSNNYNTFTWTVMEIDLIYKRVN